MDTCTGHIYWVHLVDENIYYLSLHFLSNNNFIFVTSRNYIGERPFQAAEEIKAQIFGCIPTSLTTYPEGLPPNRISSLSLDVGQGIYPWPERVFAPYVDITAWPTYQVATTGQTTGVRFYNLGFIVAQSATDCTPSWGTYYALDNIPGMSQISQLRQMGGDVCVSFGGAANTPIHICAPDATTLKNLYMQVINAYNFRRIDFDIEGAWVENTTANLRNAQALKMLQDELESQNKPIEIWLTLPILTTGLVQSGLTILQQMMNAGVTITGINGMAMDYGGPIADMGQAAIDAITNLNEQLGGNAYQMIGVTPMVGQNDVQGEIFTVSNAMDVLAFCESNNVRQIAMWSSNRDNPSATQLPIMDNAFSLTFQPYTQNGNSILRKGLFRPVRT